MLTLPSVEHYNTECYNVHMSKKTTYFYHYSYEDGEQAIAQTLYQLLFPNQAYQSHFFSHQTYHPDYCVHLHYRIDILVQGDTIETLLNNSQTLNLSTYHLKYLIIGQEFDYPTRLAITKQIAQALPGIGTLDNPDQELYWGFHQNQWFIGTKLDNQYPYKLHKHRPHQYSNSLPTRLCHSLMVLVDQYFTHPKIIDPCCGVGTLLVEALLNNQQITGYEINPLIASHGNANLVYFNLPPVIKNQDMLSSRDTFDLVILDIPYGLYNPYEYQSQLLLLQHCPRLAPYLLLISIEEPSILLQQLGYQPIMQTSITKGKFTRLITLVKHSLSYQPISNVLRKLETT
jgi:tRNA (guanine10-N2)-dimethyltransferase